MHEPDIMFSSNDRNWNRPAPATVAVQHPLGWHPPLAITPEDLLTEDLYLKHRDNLPVGLVTNALKMGRTVRMTTLHKALQDLFLELETVQNFLVSPNSKDEWSYFDREMYIELLRRDLDRVSSAINNQGCAHDDHFVHGPPELTISSSCGSTFTNVSHDELNEASRDIQGLEKFVLDESPEFWDMEITPQKNDVLLGRGAGPMKHAGNVAWRALLARYKDEFAAIPRGQRRLFAKKLVKMVRQQDPPGRFLQCDPVTNLWFDVGDRRAVQKASQALRDIQPQVLTVQGCKSKGNRL